MYIRTKNGVVKVETVADIQTKVIYEDNFVNQSENLEELCDEIVYDGHLYQNKITWDNCIVEDSFEELEEPITDEMIKHGIYGAIWTSKGLIYVAKMDENGELELI